MRQPEMYTAEYMREWSNTTVNKNNVEVLVRPEGTNAWPWTWRWKLAWNVLTGKADALAWDDYFD